MLKQKKQRLKTEGFFDGIDWLKVVRDMEVTIEQLRWLRRAYNKRENFDLTMIDETLDGARVRLKSLNDLYRKIEGKYLKYQIKEVRPSYDLNAIKKDLIKRFGPSYRMLKHYVEGQKVGQKGDVSV